MTEFGSRGIIIKIFQTLLALPGIHVRILSFGYSDRFPFQKSRQIRRYDRYAVNQDLLSAHATFP